MRPSHLAAGGARRTSSCGKFLRRAGPRQHPMTTSSSGLDLLLRGRGLRRLGAVHPRSAWTYSLARLSHYTATDCGPFSEPRSLHQLPVLRGLSFETYARPPFADPADGLHVLRLHRKRRDHHARRPAAGAREDAADAGLSPSSGRTGRRITLVNIGWAVLTPKTRDGPRRRAAAQCLADGRPLRGVAEIPASWGIWWLAHAYLREDRCARRRTCPAGCRSPPLAEIQVALETAWRQITELEGYELKRINAHGHVATSTTATGNCATSAARCSG